MRNVSGPYAAWASWLDAFGRGEDLPTTHLPPISEEMGPDMQERLLRRINQAFVARQDWWVAAFVRDREQAEPTPLGLATNLIDARARLRPLVALTRSELLSAPMRAVFGEALEKVVRDSQRNLENSVRRQTHNVDAMLTTVRENDLTRALTTPSTVDSPRNRPGGRTIIV